MINQPGILNPSYKRVADSLNKAIGTEKWMSAVWRIEDGKIILDRTTHSFPIADMKKAVEMLQRDLPSVTNYSETPNS